MSKYLHLIINYLTYNWWNSKLLETGSCSNFLLKNFREFRILTISFSLTEKWVHRYLKAWIYKSWDDTFHKCILTQSQGWIRIDFNQFNIQLLIQHKIESKPFKTIVIISNLPYQAIACCIECISNTLFDLWQDCLNKAYILLGHHVFVHLSEADFALRLEWTVVIRILLYVVIGKMNN
jgi:hypothetical protein